jgi:hypothetical protein
MKQFLPLNEENAREQKTDLQKRREQLKKGFSPSLWVLTAVSNISFMEN